MKSTYTAGACFIAAMIDGFLYPAALCSLLNAKVLRLLLLCFERAGIHLSINNNSRRAFGSGEGTGRLMLPIFPPHTMLIMAGAEGEKFD